MGLGVLECVEEERKKRTEIKKIYNKNLEDIPGITIMPEQEKVKSSYQYYAVRINEKEFGKSRDYVYDKLKEYNIFSRKYFYPLCSNYECYKRLPSSDSNNLPIANKVANEVLTLPFYGELDVEIIKEICEMMRCLYAQ